LRYFISQEEQQFVQKHQRLAYSLGAIRYNGSNSSTSREMNCPDKGNSGWWYFRSHYLKLARRFCFFIAGHTAVDKKGSESLDRAGHV